MWNSHICLEKLYKFRSASPKLPPLYFKNINVKDARSPSGLVIKYGKLRRNAPPMRGVFATKKFEKGEFICTWGGIFVLDNEDLKSALNYHHLTKYGMEYKLDGIQYYACAPLDANGFPWIDGPTAPFLNEPDKHTITVWIGDRTDIKERDKNVPFQNVCVHTMRRRLNKEKGIDPGNIGPIFFAARDIEIGEELVWSYGGEFDRDGYEDQVPKENSLSCDIFQRVVFEELTHISSVKDDEQVFMRLNGALKKDVKTRLTKERDALVRKVNGEIEEDEEMEEISPSSRRTSRQSSTKKDDSIDKSFEDIKSELGKRLNTNNKSLHHKKYVELTLVPILEDYEKIVYENMTAIKEENPSLWTGLSRMFKNFALDFKALITSDGSMVGQVFDKEKYASSVFKDDSSKSWLTSSFKRENPYSSLYAATFFFMIDTMNKAYKYKYPVEEDTNELYKRKKQIK